MDNPENKDHKSLWDTQEDTKIKAILETFENEFLNGDSYTIWSVITICNHYKLAYPEWITKELGRIAKRINALEKPDKGSSYSDQIASILNMKRFARRTKDTENLYSKVRGLCLIKIRRGDQRRKDVVELVSNTLGLNQRQVETLYDEVKKEHEDWIKSNNE